MSATLGAKDVPLALPVAGGRAGGVKTTGPGRARDRPVAPLSAARSRHRAVGDRRVCLVVVVVGAGMAGLVATTELQEQGVSVVCLEDRDHVGGRAASVSGGMDLGATWFWDGQAVIAETVTSLGLATYAQVLDGDALIDQPHGATCLDGNPIDRPGWRARGHAGRTAPAHPSTSRAHGADVGRGRVGRVRSRWLGAGHHEHGDVHRVGGAAGGSAQARGRVDRIRAGAATRARRGGTGGAHLDERHREGARPLRGAVPASSRPGGSQRSATSGPPASSTITAAP